MAEIMGTVTSVKRYLSPEKIELKISPDLGGESTIILQQNRKYIIPDFQREIRWEENNLSILLSDLSTSPRFLGNIILTIKKNGDCQIIDGQQRTTVLLLILAYIKSRYKEKLEPFTPCSIENRSFTGLSELMENGFADELLENPAITKTDYYGQRQSFINLWTWLKKEELLATSATAKTILHNIETSQVNIIASHEDESNSSIRYFLDVNLKGVQLDTEDIFKAQIFSLNLSDDMLQLWRENKAAMLTFNQTKEKGGTDKKVKERYPLMKVYEHYFYCDLFKSKPELEQEKLQVYNAGGSQNDDFYEKLLKLMEELRAEEERHIKEDLSEAELELFDLLRKEHLTVDEEKRVKLAAKELYNTLTEKRKELFIVGWQNDPQPKERVKGEIVYILNKFLPESYDREIFLRKSTLVFDHIVDQAMTGYNWVA